MSANKMSLSELRDEYPKMAMIMDYIASHYPKDWEKFADIKMFQALLLNTDYSNTQIEDMIDKIAIFNGFKKWSPES